MKKKFLIMLSLLTVMVMLFSAAVTPAAAKNGENTITLIYVQYIPGKGVAFKFKVHGEFKDFAAVAIIKGHEYNLDCKLNEDDTLSCLADQGLRKYIDEIATVTINGYTFTTPIRGSAAPSLYCYPVFDEVNTEGGEQPPVFTASESAPWEQAGTYCQTVPASVGDEIYWYNPAFNGWYYYFYSLDGQDIWTSPPDLGPGYYWDIIPA